MKLVYRLVQELRQFDANPKTRTNAETGVMKRLEDSIKEFGVLNPLRIRGDIVEDGNRRLFVARKLGIVEVPCLDVSDEKVSSEDGYLELNYAVKPFEGVQHIELYLEGMPLRKHGPVRYIKEIEERFGKKMLKLMVKHKVGHRAYVIAKRFIDSYSEFDDNNTLDKLEQTLLWCINHGSARMLEIAMAAQIEPDDMWDFISEGRTWTVTRTFVLRPKKKE